MKRVTSVAAIFILLALSSALALAPTAQAAKDLPIIHHASVQPTKVYPGDTMTVTAEVSDSSGVESVTADMGGIETISLSLIEGSIEHGTWQGEWLVHDTQARDYVTTIVATNSRGKSSAADVLWSDPQTYERYWKQYATEQTTSEITWQDALTLTFTPNVAGNFLVLADALVGSSSAVNYSEAQVIYDSTVINSKQFYPESATARCPFRAHNVVYLNATQYTFKIQYRTSDAAETAYIKNCLLLIVNVSDYRHVAEDTVSSTDLETYQDKATITFTPAADDYLVIATMDIAGSATNRSILTQLLAGPTGSETSWGEMSRQPNVASRYMMGIIMREQTLTATEHTFKIQYMSELAGGTSTTYIKNARITVIRLSDLGDAEYTESEAVSSGTHTTYDHVDALKLTKTFDHTTYENHMTFCIGLFGGSSTAKKTYAASYKDTVLIEERFGKPHATTDYIPLWAIEHSYYDSGSHTLEVKYKTDSPATAYIKNARATSIRMDTLTPFGDSGHTTYNNTFDTQAEDTVYIQGAFFEPSHAYHVAYYDGGSAHDGVNGAKVLSDGGVTSDANGVVNSLWHFPNNQSASYGIWHAVIYDDSVGAPPETYSANDTTSIRESTFTVTAAAIPEIPTVIAAIVVAGLCAGIYWWMRRRLAYVRVSS